MSDLHTLFRRACARLAKPRGWVRVFVHDAAGVPSVNFAEPGASEAFGETEDYREVHPDWLRPVDGMLDLYIKVEHDRSDKYLNVFLHESGAWLDKARTKPLFRTSVKKPPLRDQAIAKFGEARVVETEQVIESTVARLLAAPVLRKMDISTHARPKITFRWTTGKSHGGIRGLSFALWHHAAKPDTGARFAEYASFAHDLDIGSFIGTRQQCLSILAAHELAHWLQYAPNVKRPPLHWKPPHGEGFRVVYRTLRKVLANEMLA